MVKNTAGKQLILLRHAKSDWSSDARTDFDRPLSKRGRHDAPNMGSWLAENGYVPDVVISSPSARTIETSELVCTNIGYDVDQVVYDQRLYHGLDSHIRKIATDQLEQYNCVMLVAHNPGMEMALLDYCPSAESFADGKFMPTCTVAVIEFEQGDQEYIRCRLKVMMRPSGL